MAAPIDPNSSPKIRPNTIALDAQASITVDTERNGASGEDFRRSSHPRAASSRPYPTSPSISPKNAGKKIATNGVGSIVPYLGNGSARVSTSNGRKSRGL